MDNTRVFRMAFASVYPLYIQKAERKGRTKADVDAIIYWLTGYEDRTLQQQVDKKSDFETFFAQAPRINPNVSKITGVICGYRVEAIEDKLMQRIRYLDKLVDELAKGKAMERILRRYNPYHRPANIFTICSFFDCATGTFDPSCISI